jgi:hypothetical protein
MDSGYADALVRLEDDLSAACSRASEVLTTKEVAAELRRYADELEDE